MIYCTKCGCPESREIERRNWWGNPVSVRICGMCGHKFRAELPDDQAEHAAGNGSAGVIYTPIRCPKCNSKEIKTTSTRKPVRHHKCTGCGHNFKSVEGD